MVPIQVILLLVLVSLPAAIDPTAWTHLSARFGAVSFAAMLLGLLVMVGLRTRAAVAAMHDPESAGDGAVAMRTDQMFGRARWATLLITAFHFFGTRLPYAVSERIDAVKGLKDTPLAEVLFLLPVIGVWIVLWAFSYKVETAGRERTLAYRLAQAMPAHDMPTLGQYLSMQCRHNFYVLLPITIHSVIMMTGLWLGNWVPYADVVAAPVSMGVVLLMMPWMVVRIWSTVPLKGPLRFKLDSVAAAYRLRFRNILLWKTHNGVTNAAILGWVPFARYFLMTDELLETLTDRQVEAVFAHEVGHGVHRHLWWYLAGFTGAFFLAGGLAGVWTLCMPEHVATFAGRDTAGFLSLGLLFGMLAFGFPLVSHRFEHQADWFACRHMAGSVDRALAARDPVVLEPSERAPEVITLDDYRAGLYPNAPQGKIAEGIELPPAPPGAVPHPPLPPGTLPDELPEVEAMSAAEAPGLAEWLTAVPPTVDPLPRMTPAMAGTEIFISALDTIVETSQRSRDRRGWMHPSINERERLLRKLTRNPEAADGFQRHMWRTRVWIVAFCVVGVLVGTIAVWMDSGPEKSTATAPAASVPADRR